MKEIIPISLCAEDKLSLNLVKEKVRVTMEVGLHNRAGSASSIFVGCTKP
jgi:hypothetical protein